MRRTAVVVALVFGLLGSTGRPVSAGTGAELLPDLVVQRASDLDLEVTPSGRHRLRFTTTTANVGVGVVELEPVKDDCDQDGDVENDRTAVQHTYVDEDGNGIFDPAVDLGSVPTAVGCFVFHAQHDHWHFEDFARYRLVNPRTHRTVATQAKVGFCLVDTYRWRPNTSGSPSSGYYRSCQPDALQGLSPGWADTYLAFLADQSLDVTGLAPGRYCLVQRIDPAKRITEGEDANNVNRTPIRLGNTSATPRAGIC